MLKQQQFLCVASDSIWLVILVQGRFLQICTPRLAMQQPGPKSIPFDGCLVVHQPLVTLVIPDWPL